MSVEIDGAVSASLSQAERRLAAFAKGPVREISQEIAGTFQAAADKMGEAMERAALRGEASFERFARIALQEFAKVAAEQIKLSASTRAPTAPSAPGIILNVNASANAPQEDVARTATQMAAQIARLVARGARQL